MGKAACAHGAPLLSLVVGLLLAGCRPDGVMEQVAWVQEPPFPDIVGDTPVEPLPVPESQNVASVAGSASVQGGAASYVIPINIPPGRRGMQPHVALRYDSRGANGVAGVGWSLVAGSGIYRCPRNVAQDAARRGLAFDELDRLCLDGRRLINVRGTHGRAGSEYRTEIDEHARITLLGGDMDAMTSYFRVETRAGTIHDYGAPDTPGAAANAVYVPDGAPAPLAWKLRRVTDAQGNSIQYEYGPSATGHVLRAIRYTGTGTTPGDRLVAFDYQH